ncbi:MAG: hypothetical protein B0D85_06710, partial [Candidatus Sedimenticola endophacoides]
AHNEAHGITPRTIRKAIADIMEGAHAGAPMPAERYARVAETEAEYAAMSPKQMARRIQELERQMYQYARDLEFEEAARVRDRIRALREKGVLA